MAVPAEELRDPSGAQRHMGVRKSSFQAVQDGGGPVRHREHPVAPLRFQRAAQALKEGLCLFRREGSHGAVEEAAIAGSVLQDLLCRAVVCHIAAALAGDQQLFPQPVIPLQQDHIGPVFCGSNGSKHPGGTAADNKYVTGHRTLPAFHRHYIRPRCAPGSQRYGQPPSPFWQQWQRSKH